MKKHSHSKAGQVSLIALAAVVLLVVAAVTGLALKRGAGAERSQADAFVVRRGTFDISIPVTGELAALKQIEIRNNLDSRAIITDIVPEGTFVQAGDVVMRLNDEEIRNRLRDAQDKVNVADASLIAAQAKLEIQIKARDLAVALAELALKAWQEGEAKTRLEELKLAVDTAQKEFARLDDRYTQSLELVKREFISQDELRRDEIAKMKAEFDLAKTKNELMIYETYQYHQDKAQKESAVEQARIERDAEVRSATSDVESKQFQLDSAKEKLAETRQQLEYCTIRAPSPGLVVYYASTQTGGMGRNEGRPPMVGTELTRNELVLILPDTSQMVATVKISEALVGQIQTGQRATINCDAMPDRVLHGQVLSVGVLAESGGWRDPNRRDYTVKLKLNDGNELGLKPSMRCKANIYVGRIQNALHVPIQAVSRAGAISYVYTPQGPGYAQTKVVTGASSELYVEVVDGLKEGDVALLRQPQPEEIVSRLVIPKSEETENAEANQPAMQAPSGMSGMMEGGGGPGGRPDGMRRRGGGPGAPGNPGAGEGGSTGGGGMGGDRNRANNAPSGNK